jgi:hypothetical protein
MVAFLTQLLLAIRSRFTSRARLEAENLLLRQQLVVLRRKSPKRVRLWNIDRLLLVWLYRRYAREFFKWEFLMPREEPRLRERALRTQNRAPPERLAAIA